MLLQNEKADNVAHFLVFGRNKLMLRIIKLHTNFGLISGKIFLFSEFLILRGFKWVIWDSVCQNISKNGTLCIIPCLVLYSL